MVAMTRSASLLPKVISLLFLGLPDCLPAQTSSQNDPQLAQMMQRGMDAMRQGKAAEAEAQFPQACLAAPTYADAFMGLGLAQLRDGKPDEATKALSRAIELNPEMPGAHMFLGIAFYQQKKADEAIAALQKEITLQPKNAEALTWLGIVELESGHPDDAVTPLDRAAELSPKDPNVLDYRGQAHMRVAQESYQALTKLDPDSWHVHRALGESLAESGQPEKAIAEYEAAIKKQPHNADLYESLGNEYQKISRFDDAAKAYQQELTLSPNNPIALYNLGQDQGAKRQSGRGRDPAQAGHRSARQPRAGRFLSRAGTRQIGTESAGGRVPGEGFGEQPFRLHPPEHLLRAGPRLRKAQPQGRFQPRLGRVDAAQGAGI